MRDGESENNVTTLKKGKKMRRRRRDKRGDRAGEKETRTEGRNVLGDPTGVVAVAALSRRAIGVLGVDTRVASTSPYWILR